jgi:iron complex outermembrane receptor protein
MVGSSGSGRIALRALAYGTVAAAALNAVPAWSQQQAPATPPAAPAAQDTTGVGDIIVTAQRREQSLSKVPVSIQAVSAQTLKVLVITDTPSLVAATPSVNYTNGFSANSSGFIIRGITSASAEGGIQQSTSMVMDGVPLVRPGEFVGDLGDIERVEVLRGPQGTLFGKNATAGVVSIITKKPTSKFEASLDGSVTTDQEYLTRGMVNLPLGDGVALRLNGYYRNLNPLIHNLGRGGDMYGAEAYGFSGKLSIDLGPDVNLLLSGDYRHSVTSFGQLIPLIPSTFIGPLTVAALGYTPRVGLNQINTDGKTTDQSQGYSFAAELGWRITPGLKFTSISAYRDYRDDTVNDVDGTPVGVDAGTGFTPNPTGYPVMFVMNSPPPVKDRVHYFSEEARLNYSGDRVDVVGGLYYQSMVNSGGNNVPFIFNGAYLGFGPLAANTLFYNSTPVSFKLNDDTWAAFGDVTFKVTDTVSLFGGLRYTHEKIKDNYASNAYFLQITDGAGVLLPAPGGGLIFDPITTKINGPSAATAFVLESSTNNLSGRAGIQWQPAAGLNFYFSYNRGYKGSAVDTSRSAAAPSATYSPILAPEKARSFELGTKLQLFDNRLQVNLNLFDEKIDNLQQTIVLPSTATQLINAGAVKTRGVEFDARARVATGLTIDGAVTYNDPHYSGDVFVGCWPGQTVAQGCVGGRENLNGLQTVNSYKWRYNIGATYTNDLPGLPVNMVARVGWNWSDSSPQRVGDDPLLREPSHGLLDASLTIASDNQRWSVQIFGKNLTNQSYYNGRVEINAIVARVAGYIPRDYKRYGGLRLTINL